MNTLFWPLEELDAYRDVKERMEKNQYPAEIYGCMDSGKTYLMAALGGKGPYVIVTYDEIRAKAICEELKTYYHEDRIFYYPAKDMIFYSGDIRGNTITAERMKVIKNLLENKPLTVVTTLETGLERVMPAKYLAEKSLHLHEGDDLDTAVLFKELAELGYERMGQVEEPGQFAVRGEIIDIYPLTEETPYRIDLWDTEIDTIQRFDVLSQRSIERVSELAVYPACEFLLDDDTLLAGLALINSDEKKFEDKLRKSGKIEEAARIKHTIEEFADNLQNFRNYVGIESFVTYFCRETVSFFDYFNDDNSIIFMDEPARLAEKGTAVMTEFTDSMKGRIEKGYILPKQAKAIYSESEVFAKLEGARTVMLSMMERKGAVRPASKFSLSMQGVSGYNSSFETLVQDLKKWKQRGYRMAILSASSSRAARLAEDLRENGLTAAFTESPEKTLIPGEIVVAKGSLHKGFEYPLLKYVVISEADIFGSSVNKKKSRKHKPDGRNILTVADLKPGDYIVHENHGIGIYRGIEQLSVDSVQRDYIKIENGDGGELVLPLIGVVISAIGIFLEATADKQKSEQKAKRPDMVATEGLFKMVRCPNYFGEITFWTGVFIGGISTYAGVGQWLFAIIGYVAIVYIMINGAQRLDRRQEKANGHKPEYRAYADSTPLIVPFIPVSHIGSYKD